jgi:hypothetical protein
VSNAQLVWSKLAGFKLGHPITRIMKAMHPTLRLTYVQ